MKPRKMNKPLFSVLEQHVDGSWWYHPGLTYATKEEAEQGFLEHFWWDKGRPHMIFEHTEPLCQEISTCTRNFKTFDFQGLIKWPKEKEE